MYYVDRYILNIDTGLASERRYVCNTKDEVDDCVFDLLASSAAHTIEISEFDPDLGTWEFDSLIRPKPSSQAIAAHDDSVFLYSEEAV